MDLVKKFINDNSYLFWDVKKEGLSNEVILEKIIDFGTLEQLEKFYKILGKEKFKQSFLNNLIDKNGNIKDRININDFHMIRLLAYKLKIENEIPLGDIISRAKKTSIYSI